eukprot:CAMPEP_0168331516 /NCGR_PEP_ID=MMETSP0213-20121227/8380_1 /TAXON_ID=151035 /ORGANISM="Euplotes harpa, Strain FSP1.4" /LENGTH=86 /DNA_ID=CAMNT_0008335307 /DNA_START=185 /DNA_END=445 /DNA_ORIENTATION=-
MESNIKKHFYTCIKFIDSALEADEHVLVHCAAGVSRSPTMVIAYLMHKNQWTFEKAFAFVKNKRSCVDPNSAHSKNNSKDLSLKKE